jgi:hypothetical protein
VLVNEPLVTMPLEKRANAASVMAPSVMLIKEKGFFSTLADAMADKPAKKKAAEDTAPCARVKSLVKIPTPIAPTAIRSSSMFRVLKSGVCLCRYVPESSNSPRRKADSSTVYLFVGPRSPYVAIFNYEPTLFLFGISTFS